MGKRRTDIDYESLGRNRRIKKAGYNLARNVLGFLVRRGFDVKFEGQENLPDRSAMIATHHCVGFDWILNLMSTDKKCHGWFDESIVSRNSFVERFYELICVKTDNGVTTDDFRRTKELSKYWLENSDDWVATVTDGPSKHCFYDDGKVMELKDRPLHSGFVDIASKTGAPIVPYACWIPEEHRQRLFASQGFWNDAKYLLRNRKIPYRGIFGEPLDPKDFKKGRLKKLVREKQLEMEDYLRKQ
jgi:1-acyl-sn-glycerol-3-phosphate acyltransferase